MMTQVPTRGALNTLCAIRESSPPACGRTSQTRSNKKSLYLLITNEPAWCAQNAVPKVLQGSRHTISKEVHLTDSKKKINKIEK